LDLGGGKFIEFAKNWLLPIILGFVIGLAISLLFDIYRLLYSASLLIVGWNPLLRLLCTFIALLGGYLIGLIVGVIGLFYPEALGLGYDFIHKTTLAKLGELSLTTLIALLLFKIVATSITLNFGGSGGLFVPSLYVGGTLGLIYAQTLNTEPPTLCVVLAMAAMLAATNKTLLTSITLVAETVGQAL